MRSNDFDIVIAGGGMVGACCAIALSKRGFRIAVVEASTFKPDTVTADQAFDLRVSAVSPRSQEILESLGIWQQLLPDRVCPYEKMFVWHQNGSASVALDAVELARQQLGSIVENRVLQQAFANACHQSELIQWFQPDHIEALSENSETGVALELASGRHLRSQLLIAADGRGSPTREMAQIETQNGQYQQTAFVANVTTELPHQSTAWQRFLSTGPLAFLPLSNGQSSIVWSCDDSFAETLKPLSTHDFCHSLEVAFEGKLGQITGCSERLSFPLGWHHCDQWVNNRVLLVGDAAHSVHPLAGQGVNLGFSDVELLFQLLDNSSKPIQASRLRRYERQRKSETWLATQSFSGLKWFFGMEQKSVASIRDIGMRVVSRNPFLRRGLMRRAIENLT
ncbi:MAG: UbiH/UbiF/VisC/COQ6 family ubiquinone biosynthesis hydroxylase [Pseudomonadota bacterium]